ncbi:hypothetical protein CHLRE_06g278092v5 [Chlamydomonas reinhardtii]|uniref:Uncharacterized protein n=1 Tax=Chlamydomonas reinhardtii TaxID=3055 RepID=A0A2K3DNU5_CHLRE|nr:uncharacterized protein CHLRE_06g278092v5 [Chlamydomonas reinhardtii]PNW82197.1 hypothetical protein CHLRE_06g278092v5 [Chlamydomonas reinhardtii]
MVALSSTVSTSALQFDIGHELTGVCIIPSDPRLEAAWLEGSEGPYGAGINIPLPEYGADNFRRTVAGLRRRAGRQFFDANGNHQFCGSCAGHLNYVTQKFCAFYIFNEEGGGWALSVLLDIVKLLKPDTPAHWNWKWGFHWVMVVDVYDFILHWEYELILVVYGSLCGFTCWLLYWLVYDRPQHKETTRLSWGRLLLRHCYQRRQPPAALRALQLQFQEARARREAEEAAATGSGNANNAPTGISTSRCSPPLLPPPAAPQRQSLAQAGGQERTNSCPGVAGGVAAPAAASAAPATGAPRNSRSSAAATPHIAGSVGRSAAAPAARQGHQQRTAAHAQRLTPSQHQQPQPYQQPQRPGLARAQRHEASSSEQQRSSTTTRGASPSIATCTMPSAGVFAAVAAAAAAPPLSSRRSGVASNGSARPAGVGGDRAPGMASGGSSDGSRGSRGGGSSSGNSAARAAAAVAAAATRAAQVPAAPQHAQPARPAASHPAASSIRPPCSVESTTNTTTSSTATTNNITATANASSAANAALPLHPPPAPPTWQQGPRLHTAAKAAAAAAADSGSESETDECCFICMDAAAVVGFRHADGFVHMGVCGGCVRELQARGLDRTCPLCRRAVVALETLQPALLAPPLPPVLAYRPLVAAY